MIENRINIKLVNLVNHQSSSILFLLFKYIYSPKLWSIKYIVLYFYLIIEN